MCELIFRYTDTRVQEHERCFQLNVFPQHKVGVGHIVNLPDSALYTLLCIQGENMFR